MRIAIMGAGGVGGYVGAKLSLAGHDVSVIARGDHLRAIQDKGLRLRSKGVEFLSRPRATDAPGEVDSVDLVVFAVKAYDTFSAAERARPLVGPLTTVLTVQNGLDNPQILASAFGKERILGGSIRMAAHVAEPGVVQHSGMQCEITFSEMDGRVTPRAEHMQAMLIEAGITTHLVTDPQRLLWEKVIFLGPLSAVCTVASVPVGTLRECPETMALLAAAIRESWLVGRSEGTHLDFQLPDNTIRSIRALEPAMKPSMLIDKERGRRLEADAIQGAVVRRAQARNVQVPVLETLYRLLKLWAGDQPDQLA